MEEVASSPVDIASKRARRSSKLPTSNLTTALQSTSGNGLKAQGDGMNGGGKSSGRQDSIGGLTPMYSGAQPISMNGSERAGGVRRDSAAGSMMAGMSWGGVSVGSWVRDDVLMQGTSPYACKSPSFTSSSYLPKLEANFMRDFSCCGLILATLHDLLQHFEEAHAQSAVSPHPMTAQYTMNQENDMPLATRGLDQHTRSQQHQPSPHIPNASAPGTPRNPIQSFKPGEFGGTQLQPIQDIDSIEDMEMDDLTAGPFDDTFSPDPPFSQQPRSQLAGRPRFGQPASRLPPLDLRSLNPSSPISPHPSFQGLRPSQPSTPIAGRPAAAIYHNPTVSSVNTPTLNAHPLQHVHLRNGTPDSSAPGTPAELDPDFLGDVSSMSVTTPTAYLHAHGLGAPGNITPHSPGLVNGTAGRSGSSTYDFRHPDALHDMCIDDPAKRLYAPNGAFASTSSSSHLAHGHDRALGPQALSSGQASAHARLGAAQYGPDSDLARTIREQQRQAGLADTVGTGLEGGEGKPFRCPVIGCEKAYKNQNGLKYHKSHGHNNQQLHENLNGTFSIVDPQTLSPYPGTLGMEKEKPFKCDMCGKRYKNLNGLKYHKSHSTPCNPDAKGVSHVSSVPMGGVTLGGMAGVTPGAMGVGLSGMANGSVPSLMPISMDVMGGVGGGQIGGAMYVGQMGVPVGGHRRAHEAVAGSGMTL